MFEGVPVPDTLSEYLRNAANICLIACRATRAVPDGERDRRRMLVSLALSRCAEILGGLKAMTDAGTPLWVSVGTARGALELATRILAAQRGANGWDRLIGNWSREVDNHMERAGRHIPEVAQLQQQMAVELAQLPPFQAPPLTRFDEAVQEVIDWDRANPTAVFNGEGMDGFYHTDVGILHHCTHVNLIWVSGQTNDALEAALRNAVYWSTVWLLRAGGDLSGAGDAWAIEVLRQRLLTMPAMRAAMDEAQGENQGGK